VLEAHKHVTAETVFLVGVYGGTDALEPDRRLDELAGLVEAAGGVVVGRLYQRRRAAEGDSDRPLHPATYIGRGKVEQVRDLVKDLEAKLVVFDNELSPAQIRELEKQLETRVIDRSELILDIFASRARSREAKLQVELAQLEYTAPRLRGMWTHLERQAGAGSAGGAGGVGGVGTRGPGEKQIEIDRRIVGTRIARLKKELEEIQARRNREVDSRSDGAFCVGLVGYTNAGKSTLMNAVTGAGTYAADQLFATLDTKTRRWELEPGLTATLSDTVGFVRNLPHHLVASFRSTLSEALNADLLLHVVDSSHPDAALQMETVNEVVAELGPDMKNALVVFNKADAVSDPEALEMLQLDVPQGIVVSARTGQGLDALRAELATRCRQDWVAARLQIPAANGKALAYVRAHAQIGTERYQDDAWLADVRMARSRVAALRKLVASGGQVDVPGEPSVERPEF